MSERVTRLPFAWAQSDGVHTLLLTGGSIAVPANSAIVALDEWFDVLRLTWYSAGPTLHTAVLDKAKSLQNAQAAHTLRFVVSGGAPLPKEVQDGLQRILGVPVLEHYGSSEAAQIATKQPPPGPNRPRQLARKIATSGGLRLGSRLGEPGHPDHRSQLADSDRQPLKGTQVLSRPSAKVHEAATSSLDLRDIKGQESAKRALEIAAAGGHHFMPMVG